MMAIQASMEGGKIVYIDTEGSFSADRLVEMACYRFPQYYAPEDGSTSKVEELANTVLVYHPKTSKELNQTLNDLENVIIKENVKLIILDSVASVMRREFDSSNISERQAMLLEQAQLLKRLAERFDLPVIVTNQVTTKVNEVDAAVGAALGPLWAHAVNMRLVLEWLGELAVGSRRLWVAKSPICSVSYVEYDIREAGLVCSSFEMTDVDTNYWGVDGKIINKRSE
jgi:RAD51-like protein 1